MPSWKGRFVAIVALLLLSIGLAAAAEPFVHTDDGCAVEKHCLACQRTVSSIALVTATLALPQALEPLGQLDAVASDAPVEAPGRLATSRGPPQA